MRRSGGLKPRATALAITLLAAALASTTSPAVARTTCVELVCPVEAATTSGSTNSTTTSTSSTTSEVWNVVLDEPSRPPTSGSRPMVMTEAQRDAQLRTQFQQDVYEVPPPAVCGQIPMLPCPDPAAAARTAQQVTSTNTTTTTRTSVTVQEVAERARAKIHLAKPNIGSAPCSSPGCQGTVGVPVGLWTQALPSQSASDSAGGRTVSVSSEVTKVTWDLGNGTTVTCNGPGTAYDPSMGWTTSPDCGVPSGYTQAGRYIMTATYHHEVTYTGVDLPTENVTSTASADVTIGELQSVVTTAR